MVMKINVMSSNVINIMESLSHNENLINLLIIDKNEAEFHGTKDRPEGFRNNKQIIKQNDEFCRILPVPFNPEAEEVDKSMIRVYYNQGEFDSELISESTLHIDIIVAKNLWLIYDESIGKGLIRPYAILEAVMDCVGRKSGNPLVSVNFTGWQHLAVNTKFDAIRLYADYFKPEV